MVTSPIGYLRPHGRNAAVPFAEEANRDTCDDECDSQEELREILDTGQVLAQRARDTYVLANNDGKWPAVAGVLGPCPGPATRGDALQRGDGPLVLWGICFLLWLLLWLLH
jgi:hypothetical protein